MIVSFSHALSDRHIFDAKWQNPFQSAKRITPILEGKNKPIYHPTVDSGDHVIVINRCGHYMDCYGGVSIKVYFLTAPSAGLDTFRYFCRYFFKIDILRMS